MLLFLVFVAIFVETLSQTCPGATPFLLASTSTCYAACPWNPPQIYYSSTFDNTCVSQCPSGWYGFDGNKTCIQTCPSSPNMTFYDNINFKCVSVCPANSFSYLGAGLQNQKCVSVCPSGTFAQQINLQCVSTCPSNTYYKNDSTPYCVVRCPDNYYANPIDKNCYIGGSCPTTPVRYYSDDTTNLCVQFCPNNTFADTTTGRCLAYCSNGFFADKITLKCVQTCPTNYYRSNVTKSCLLICTEGYFIDKLTGNCTQTCSLNTFGDFSTGFCQAECTYPAFADSSVNRCVSTCSLGTYADNFTQSCVNQMNCYSNWVGDPTTRKCVEPSNCPTSPYHYANKIAKICTPKCPVTLWGDKSTKSCVSSCPWNSMTYVSWKNPDTQQCVTQCPQFPILYADNSTQTCMAQCPGQSATVPYDTFADDLSQSCVRMCPNGFKSQKPEYICVSQCSNNPTVLYFLPQNSSCLTGCPEGYYADPSRQLCSLNCPASPDYYALDSNNSCVTDCTTGLYADSSTRSCVNWCPQTTFQYADDSTNRCVDICPIIPDYYGIQDIFSNRKCVSVCDVGLFADPLTRTCVPQCDINQGYYGELLSPVRKCILQCNNGFFADNISKTCVSKCPNIPNKYFGNSQTKKCQLQCPEFLYGNSVTNFCGQPADCQTGFFADDLTNKCVKVCPATVKTYGQSISRRCLKSCPEGKFADDTTRKCQITCNATAKLYKDPSSNRCVQTCPSIPNLYNDPFTMKCEQFCSNGWFAFDGTRKCVQICPSTPAFYGNLDTFRCVDKCPEGRYKFATNTERSCRPYCPASYMGDSYADNTTWSCVSVCPKQQNLYSLKHPDDATIRKCVKTCPVINDTAFYFSDDVTQSCVTTCPLKNLTWGDKFTLKCERNCSRNQYRDNGTFRCTYQCASPRYADNTTWNCVKICPNGTFAFALGTNRTCLRECPTGTYADNKTKFCRSLCDTGIALWSDNSTWQCVTKCPEKPDLYADPNTSKCEFNCTGGLFADKIKRSCVSALQCSPGTIGDPSTYRCVPKCPISVPLFLQVSSNTCVPQCLNGFYADNSTMKCVSICPNQPDLYAYIDATLGPICVLFCPVTYYKHLPTRTCQLSCPGPLYFSDTTTMKCVTSCPDHYFAQTIGQICVQNCSINSKYGLNNKCWSTCTGQYSKDPTTFLCVKRCPFTYFSQLNLCRPSCLIGYADPITQICQPTLCSPGYYSQTGTHLCVQDCQPEYKYDANQTCLPGCLITSDNLTNLYMDNNSYMCVNKCLPGWYADNSTRYCNTVCSNGLWADNSTGRCVSKCPLTPDFYGYQKVCYFPCPNPGIYAENITRQCLAICPAGSYADDYNQRCMDVCTLKQYSYTYVLTSITYNVCVKMCPEQFWASDSSKQCVPVCEIGTYGENVTNKCVKRCPTGTYADDFLKLCVTDCDAGRSEFKDWSTNRCVKVCPSVPSLYAQNSTRSCVSFCDIGWFGLNTTRICTQSCPSPYYADPSTAFCELKCFVGADRFADNISRSCVSNCPNYTDPITNKPVITYEDNSTKTCVLQCPFFPSLYGFNTTNACIQDCPPGTFGDNDTRLCLSTCFFNVTFNGLKKYTWADPATGFCTKQCTKGTFADNFTVQCSSGCSEGTFADNSTWRCVYICPANPISFAKSPTRQCVSQCDVGYFGDQLSRQCLTECPKLPYFYYKDYQTRRCSKNCTTTLIDQYFAEDLSQSCVTECTIGYFKSLSQHACVKCPSSCLTCIASLNCTSCLVGLFLHQGECIESCPTFPIRYYANSLSSACVSECPTPYFGFNGTGKCELNCPQKYYNDVFDNSCKDCATGCRKCSSSSICSSCLTGYVYVSTLSSCSKVCNSTHLYYVQSKCELNCIDGTFLLSDLVTCQKCSTQCATCSLSGNNCTKCANKFWYNYNCVDSCPDGFYTDSNNSCIDCKSNAAACSVQPLRYNIQTFTKDYKVFAYVKFNRPISLKSNNASSNSSQNQSQKTQQSRVLQNTQVDNPNTQNYKTKRILTLSASEMQDFSQVLIIKTAKGPIKSSSYKATIYDDKTFLVEFFDSTSLNEMTLSVQFVPGTIIDQYGNGLSDSAKTLEIQTLQTISIQTQKQTVQLKQNVNVLSWILIAVLILMMINISYPLIVLIDFLQLIYMHIFIQIKPLPYLWMHVSSSLQTLNFSFLPKLYQEINQTSSNPFYLFKKDITLLGNIQPIVYIGALFLIVYAIFWVLSTFKIKIFKCFRRRVKKIFKLRMRYSLFNEIFYFTQVYVFFFAIYQWTSNQSSKYPTLNLAISIAVALMYVGWLVFLLYKSSHYRNKLNEMPKRYKFLTMQPAQFPLDLAIRYLMKLLFCLCLLIPEKSVQIILLVVLNIVYFFFTLIYKPAVSKLTNYLNMFVSLGFVAYEICLFVYGVTEKGASAQNQWSLTLLAIAGIVLVGIIFWIMYRFVIFIKINVFGIMTLKEKEIYCAEDDIQKQNYQQDSSSTQNQNGFTFFNLNKLKYVRKSNKSLNSEYNRVNSLNNSALGEEEDKSVKNMLPQLHFNKQDQQDDDSQPQINEDQIIDQLGYHIVQKKHDSFKEKQQKLMQKNNQNLAETQLRKKKIRGSFKPLVVSIDQDELIDKNIELITQTNQIMYRTHNQAKQKIELKRQKSELKRQNIGQRNNSARQTRHKRNQNVFDDLNMSEDQEGSQIEQMILHN